MAARQRFRADFVNVVAIGPAGLHDLGGVIDGIDVGDLVVIRATDAEDGHATRYHLRVSLYMLCVLLVALGMNGTRLLEWAVRGFPPPREYVVIHHGR